MNEKKVTIVIVTWNNENDLEICIQSLAKLDYKNFDLIIVDNNSSDGTLDIIKNISFPKRRQLLSLPKNVFLTGGNNLGIKTALKNNPDYIMVLNPDTKVEPSLLTELTRIADSDTKVAAVGPKLKFFNNDYDGLLNSTGLLYDGYMQAYDRGFKEEDMGQYDTVEEVPAVSGACILYRAEIFEKAGYYSDKIKMYLDELELAIRIHKAGYKIIYNPGTTVWHSYMQSTDKSKTFNIESQKMSAWLIIALKHYPLIKKLTVFKKYLQYKIRH